MRRWSFVVVLLGLAALLAGCSSPGPPRLSVGPPHARFASLSGYATTLNWGTIPFPGVTGYNVFLNGSQVGSPTSSPYTFTSLACGTTYTLGVQAHDSGAGVGQTYSTSYSTPACPGGGSLPVNTAVPDITGNTVQGQVLTASTGTWTNTPTSYSYQWQDCVGSTCSNISGATNPTYTAQSSDQGHSLSARVAATNASGSAAVNTWNTGAISPSSRTSGFVGGAYLVGFSPPSGCSSINATCITTTNPINWTAVNQVNIFALGGNNLNETPTQNATTTGSGISPGATITSIPATVTAAIPAGPVMLTTSSTTPSSGNYQILTTTGASSGATTIPITGSPTANAAYATGSAIMVQPIGNQNGVPTGSTLTALVAAIHAHGATALISFGGSNDPYFTNDCQNGYQYLLGAWFANYINVNSLDGVEIDEEDSEGAWTPSCWNGIAQEVHSNATAAGKVPIVQGDWNPTDNVPGNITALAGTKTNIDEGAYEFYGNTFDYNCAANCGGSSASLASFLGDTTGAGWPSVKWINITAPNTGGSSSSQAASTLLATTTASASGSTTSIPVTALTATLPAGLVIIADTSSPPTTWQYLQTSGASSGATTIPITGSCTAAGWQLNTNTCSNSASTTLNASYATGSDIFLDSIGYVHGTLHTGGWDCGTNAAYASAHNMLGDLEWFDDGVANTNICFNTIQSFTGG